jgi:lipoprotein-anchoring transpeptidase ErfK/SrfK
MYKHYHSKKYNSPMPHSIFYRGGYAIHATYQTSRLGSVASKGCVRLAPSNAAALYALVQQHGARDTRITITGASVKKVYKKKRYKNRNKIRYAAL